MSLLRNVSTDQVSIGVSLPNYLLNGRYRIERKIGRGGFGVVYLARDEALHSREVAVKMPPLFSTGETWAASKFAVQIEALARIDHPGVVGVIDTGVAKDGRPFFVMQFVDGQPLSAAIAETGMAFERATPIVRQIGQALSAAHEEGILHLDVKPGNIMLQSLPGGNDHVRIIDFGIAAILKSQSQTTATQTQIVGSPSYMAPEQRRGKVSKASDVYAFGVVAYEMVTGHKPFTAEDEFQLLADQEAGIRLKPSQLRHDLPALAENLILEALSPSPEDRPKEAGRFGEELANALIGADVLKPRAPRRMILAVGLSTMLIGVASTVWLRTPNRAITYSFLVQPNASDRPSGSPELVRFGQPLHPTDSFLLLIRTAQSGHLYVLSEEQSTESINALFPSPTMYAGSSRLEANEQKRIPETSWFGFDPQPAILTLWLVWSDEPVADLERLQTWQNPRDRGSIGDPSQRAHIRGLLKTLSVGSPTDQTGRAEANVRSARRRFAWKVQLQTRSEASRKGNVGPTCRETQIDRALENRGQECPAKPS